MGGSRVSRDLKAVPSPAVCVACRPWPVPWPAHWCGGSGHSRRSARERSAVGSPCAHHIKCMCIITNNISATPSSSSPATLSSSPSWSHDWSAHEQSPVRCSLYRLHCLQGHHHHLHVTDIIITYNMSLTSSSPTTCHWHHHHLQHVTDIITTYNMSLTSSPPTTCHWPHHHLQHVTDIIITYMSLTSSPPTTCHWHHHHLQHVTDIVIIITTIIIWLINL